MSLVEAHNFLFKKIKIDASLCSMILNQLNKPRILAESMNHQCIFLLAKNAPIGLRAFLLDHLNTVIIEACFNSPFSLATFRHFLEVRSTSRVQLFNQKKRKCGKNLVLLHLQI